MAKQKSSISQYQKGDRYLYNEEVIEIVSSPSPVAKKVKVKQLYKNGKFGDPRFESKTDLSFAEKIIEESKNIIPELTSKNIPKRDNMLTVTSPSGKGKEFVFKPNKNQILIKGKINGEVDSVNETIFLDGMGLTNSFLLKEDGSNATKLSLRQLLIYSNQLTNLEKSTENDADRFSYVRLDVKLIKLSLPKIKQALAGSIDPVYLKSEEVQLQKELDEMFGPIARKATSISDFKIKARKINHIPNDTIQYFFIKYGHDKGERLNEDQAVERFMNYINNENKESNADEIIKKLREQKAKKKK